MVCTEYQGLSEQQRNDTGTVGNACTGIQADGITLGKRCQQSGRIYNRKAGYYDILQEDLEEFCAIFVMPFERIMAIDVCMKPDTRSSVRMPMGLVFT